jgi:hypothetical protein
MLLHLYGCHAISNIRSAYVSVCGGLPQHQTQAAVTSSTYRLTQYKRQGRK